MVISNTTEAGLVFDANDTATKSVPSSFPGKLLAVLWHRWNHFKISANDFGLIILPTELVPNNGTFLKKIILDLAALQQLPDEFIKSAFEIRAKYNPENGSLLSQRTSHFNSRKIVSMCEKCFIKPAIEVHHLQHQQNANDDGLIYNCDGIFYKNNLANLMSLCENCHDEIHKNFKNGSKRVKTTKGYKIQELTK
jgi:hypothetical protein